MKKLKYLVLMVMLLLVPFVAFADEENSNEVDNRAIVYFFHGDGCPHCAEAEEWFASIQEEYGSKFRIVGYETWKDETNAAIMQQVSDARGDNATGVPYIIIGDKSWIGFSEKTMGDEIKAQIDQVYQTPVEERYDALSLVGDIAPSAENEKSTASDVVALIIILVVAGGIVFAIYQARKTTN